ncbi:MAG: NAD-dependent epimerase/dehydratase family protein [Candidatus Cloacimonetes bacterium]|jgi:UDP-glucose 4-epimerase|nr:NAD-dependent epimerase/dehydratase family protein [Candidatus Cloacimonadota bacterium]MBT5990193.1 NAD-dependent epimerase/dehydratase family protein [Bacteroidota bacterium]MBT7995261.1 NAD-dependent epimerase/dehydratase family protein [Bacteroidota bacterium]
MNKPNILITGGAGFIGGHITEQLVAKGYKVRIFDNLYRGDISKFENHINNGDVEFIEGDIRYLSRLLEAMEGIEYVYHEAADCINKSLQNPVESLNINVIGTTNVFEAARMHKVKKVIFASSASVYGDPEELPMTEESPLLPITPYCIGKHSTESIAKFYSRFNDLNYIGFRYFNVYGSRQNVDAYYTNVVILFIKRIMSGQAPVINGDGKQSMDFIHVSDIANANILALEMDVNNQIFNIGTNKSTTVKQLAEILISATGKENIIPQFTGEASLVRERRADYSKAKQLLSWEPTIDVERGLMELAKDIIENPHLY